LLPRFRVTEPAAVRATRDGYVTVPGAWLICPDGLISCMLNARLDRFRSGATGELPKRRKSVFASRISTVVAPGTSEVKLRLSRGARAELRRKGVLKMQVVAVGIAKDGGSARMVKTFTVRLPKPVPAR
jgi:hypothetical protein